MAQTSGKNGSKKLILEYLLANMSRIIEANNLRAVCTNCNEGLQNTAPPKPDRLTLIANLRRATIDDQLHALEWLERKFRQKK